LISQTGWFENSKVVKWLKRIFFHIIDIILVNSWILYREKTQDKISQLQFRIKIVESVKEKYNLTNFNEITIKNKSKHFQIKQATRSTCINYSKNRKNGNDKKHL